MVELVHERETWSSKYDFVLALIGYSVGYGNVWRFPYLCFKNGGGCFLIPYLICLAVAGLPTAVLEIGLGQYTSQGGITAWSICPLLQGVGYAGALVTSYISIYFTVIIAWSLFFMFASFQSTLPWTHCGNEWNTPNCLDYSGKATFFTNNTLTNASKRASASLEYWKYRVLRVSNGLDEPGSVNWDLALCLLLAWIICYLCVCKGVKSSGKVVYFTAIAPYFVLTAILIRGVTLPGAADGIKFYLTPDWSKLGDGQVWIDAGTQVLYSYGIGIGGMLAMGSYNKFNNNFYRDTLLYAVCNGGSSFYGGFLVFSVLGFMAKKEGVEVQDVATSGPGLVFIVYPEALAQIPLAPLWSGLFFFMMVLFGLDSEFVGIESVMTALADLCPQYLRRGYRKELFTAFVCAVWFLIGLSMVTEGGIYVFQMFDLYSCSGSVLLVLLICQCVMIGWLYGQDRFYDNIKSMIGYRINPWMGWCWCFFAPMFCMFIFVFNLATYKPISYDTYVYPGWGMAIAWLLTLSSLGLIPVVMIRKLMGTSGTIRERLKILITPDWEEERGGNGIWRGGDPENNELKTSGSCTTHGGGDPENELKTSGSCTTHGGGDPENNELKTSGSCTKYGAVLLPNNR